MWTSNAPPVVREFVQLIAGLTWKTWAQGALTTLYCAISDDAIPGAFHADCATAPVLALSLDPAVRRQLREKTLKVVGMAPAAAADDHH
jgi:hypothetical protein